MKIDTSEWKRFPLSTLFVIKKGTRLTKADMQVGNIRFIGASAFNNGITKYISNNEALSPANVLTVNYNGSIGETFYQDKEFWASDDVNVLIPRFKMNRYIALFIAPLIKKTGQNKYAFIDKWKLADMERDCILLPANPLGQPDWKYMEKYMKKQEAKALVSLCKFTMSQGKNTRLDTNRWKNFFLSELGFNIQLAKGDLKAQKQPDGTIPLVSSGKINAGVCKYIAPTNDSELFPSGTITVDMFGKSFYQLTPFYAVSHGRVNMLIKEKPYSKYVALFLVNAIENTTQQFAFNNMCNSKALAKIQVKLPINKKGRPDFIYMERYMKKIEAQTSKTLHGLQKIAE